MDGRAWLGMTGEWGNAGVGGVAVGVEDCICMLLGEPYL